MNVGVFENEEKFIELYTKTQMLDAKVEYAVKQETSTLAQKYAHLGDE